VQRLTLTYQWHSAKRQAGLGGSCAKEKEEARIGGAGLGRFPFATSLNRLKLCDDLSCVGRKTRVHRLFGLAHLCRLRWPSEQIAYRAVDELKLIHEFCRESPVAIENRSGLMPEKCQFALESIDAATKCIPFIDKTLNCAC